MEHRTEGLSVLRRRHLQPGRHREPHCMSIIMCLLLTVSWRGTPPEASCYERAILLNLMSRMMSGKESDWGDDGWNRAARRLRWCWAVRAHWSFRKTLWVSPRHCRRNWAGRTNKASRKVGSDMLIEWARRWRHAPQRARALTAARFVAGGEKAGSDGDGGHATVSDNLRRRLFHNRRVGGLPCSGRLDNASQ